MAVFRVEKTNNYGNTAQKKGNQKGNKGDIIEA